MQQGEKVVHIIEPTITEQKRKNKAYRQERVVAYCRVSTKDEEQLTSYEAQQKYYNEYIRSNPNWQYVGIYADKGITGTSVRHRDEFNKMIRLCKRGKVDRIITKSISRFARNTVDCLKYTRMLKEIGVDVYFEEQGVHSMDVGAEFYITIYGSIAQSESENISENVKWGKAQAAREGKVAFSYKSFLGYKRGEDGTPEIDEEQAKIIRFIYERYLAGDSLENIAARLEEKGVLTVKGMAKWSISTLRSILTNERYKGDVIVNKTYIVDCLSKKVKVNKGERTKYYIENNHPAIIDKITFGRVQEEMAKRNSKPKASPTVVTEKGRYSAKYALTGVVVCGECKTQYRRCTWVKRGKTQIVWRCLNRIDFGSRYCHDSPTIDEGMLHSAITTAIQKVAKQTGAVDDTLKLHIAMGLKGEEDKESEMAIKVRLAEIQKEIRDMIKAVSADTVESFDEGRIQELALEQTQLQTKLTAIQEKEMAKSITESRLQDIYTILDGLKNHPLEYDDELVRKMIDTIVVLAKDKIRIVFKGGLEIDQIIE